MNSNIPQLYQFKRLKTTLVAGRYMIKLNNYFPLQNCDGLTYLQNADGNVDCV